MKSFFLCSVLFSFTAFAQSPFATCDSKSHHGSMMDFSLSAGAISIQTNDNSDSPVKWDKITVDAGNGIIKKVDGARWAIQKTIKEVNSGEMSGNLLVVKAQAGKSKLLLNINGYTGEAFLVIDDYVQSMTCDVK